MYSRILIHPTPHEHFGLFEYLLSFSKKQMLKLTFSFIYIILYLLYVMTNQLSINLTLLNTCSIWNRRKYEIILVPSNHSFFTALDFSFLLLVKLSLLILFASILVLVSVLCFFFECSLSKVIALPTIAIAIVVADSRS